MGLDVDFRTPATRGAAIVAVGLALGFYYLPLVPAVTAYVLYRGWRWYRSPNPARRRAGIGMLVVGVVLVGVSYFVVTGYVTTPGFESGAVR